MLFPLLFLSLFKPLEGVLKSLESIRKSFFLGVDLVENRMTWLSWKKVMAQKVHGGLGVSILFALNGAHISKWVWHFLSSPTSL